jgi:hypothetical protein
MRSGPARSKSFGTTGLPSETSFLASAKSKVSVAKTSFDVAVTSG